MELIQAGFFICRVIFLCSLYKIRLLSKSSVYLLVSGDDELTTHLDFVKWMFNAQLMSFNEYKRLYFIHLFTMLEFRALSESTDAGLSDTFQLTTLYANHGLSQDTRCQNVGFHTPDSTNLNVSRSD